MTVNLVPISPEDAGARLEDPALLTDVTVEFPDWCFKSRDADVRAFEVTRVFSDVVRRLVKELARYPGVELVFVDTEVSQSDQGADRPARSFRVASGARTEEIDALLGGRDPRFGLGTQTLVGVFDFLIVTPWCEVRGFMPDFAFVAFRDDAPPEIYQVFEPYAWDLEGLLEAMGAAWWRPTPEQPEPDFGNLKNSVPANLRATVEANYRGLVRPSAR